MIILIPLRIVADHMQQHIMQKLENRGIKLNRHHKTQGWLHVLFKSWMYASQRLLLILLINLLFQPSCFLQIQSWWCQVGATCAGISMLWVAGAQYQDCFQYTLYSLLASMNPAGNNTSNSSSRSGNPLYTRASRSGGRLKASRTQRHLS